MKKYMPLEGLRWSRDSGSTLCDTPQNGRSRTGWGGYKSKNLRESLPEGFSGAYETRTRDLLRDRQAF